MIATNQSHARGLMIAPALLLVLMLGGCGFNLRMNPSFAITPHEAEDELTAMSSDRKEPVRPVVVAAGLFDPGIGSSTLAMRLERVLEPGAPVISVSFIGVLTFDQCRERLIDAVEEEWPSAVDGETIEVDVVGVSMGGVIARYSARPQPDGRRLRVRRLFTICTPHLGADLAWVPTFDRRIRDMRSGSAFLTLLNEQPVATDPEIVAYVRLGDAVVGPPNAIPAHGAAWWVAPQPLDLAHLFSSADPRIVADIARYLRDEPTYTTYPPTPLPDHR